MYYDLIIVSQSTPAMIPITQRCIDTARADCKDINVIVVETGQPYLYDGMDKQIEYNGEFNYNRALNMGLKYAVGDIHILANNDLIFQSGWSRIGELMKLSGYHSASAVDSKQTFLRGDHIYESYSIGEGMNGWCLFIDDYVLDKIGSLDESVTFWYSDNLYACQIRAEGIKHGLFANCQVDHIGSQTLKKQPYRTQRQYQLGEFNQYYQREKYYAQREKTKPAHSTHL